MGWDLDTKSDIGSLLMESLTGISAAAVACEMLKNQQDGWRDQVKVGAVLKLIQQADAALAELRDRLEPLLEAGSDERDLVIKELTDALSFYADDMSWQPRKNRSTRVEVDKGAKARAALLHIQGEEEAGDGE